jgi:hypothetical protein
VPTNVSFYGYDTNHYITQLYSGLVERCRVAGVSLPSVVDTWTVYGGISNTVTIETNGVTVTNNFIKYNTTTRTNQFQPFEYTYVDPIASNTVTNTCYPYIKRSWITTWDTKFDSVISTFVNTNLLSGGTFNDYMGTITNQGEGASLPVQSKTNLFVTLGIGYVTNSVAHWTHTPHHDPADWLLAAIWSSGSNDTSWTFQQFSKMTNAHPRDATITPIAEYVRAGLSGPNVATNLVLTLAGTAWNSSGTGSVTVTEVVTFDSTNGVPLSYAWSSITGITCTAQRPNSNDAIRIAYAEQPTIYDSSPAYRLYADTLNERWIALDALRWSKKTMTTWTAGDTNAAGGGDNTYTSFAALQAYLDGIYPLKTISFANQGTCGTFARFEGSGKYAARIVNLQPWTCSNQAPTTAFFYTTDFYWYSRAIAYGGSSTGNVWNAMGTPLLQDQFALIGTNSAPTNASWSFMAGSIGDTNKPAWCGDPVLTGNYSSYGYNSSIGLSTPGQALYKWDQVTNGFFYVR